MKSWLNANKQVFLQVLKKLWGSPLPHLITIAVIGVTLSLPAGLYLVIENMRSAVGNIKTEPQLTLFLALDSRPAQIKAIEQRLAQMSVVRDVRFLGRESAWLALKEKSGLNEMLTGLQENPLPDAFIIHTNYIDPAAIEKLKQEISSWPNIERAQLDTAWVKRLFAILQLGKTAVLILAGLLGFALFTIIGNTIRLQILTQREEIEVSKLIGATNTFIRRPFLYVGVLHGLLGGVMACLILSVALYIFNLSVSDLARLYASNFVLSPFGLNASLVLIFSSGLLGWLGSWTAVNRHLSRLNL